jgi:hypothetical protein
MKLATSSLSSDAIDDQRGKRKQSPVVPLIFLLLSFSLVLVVLIGISFE